MAQNYIGVDLSSDWIDIHDPIRGTSRIANSNAALARWMEAFAPEDFSYSKRPAAVIARFCKKQRPVASRCGGSIHCMDGTSVAH